MLQLHRLPLKFAFVFGSVAKGEEKATSDVDLMVISDVGLRKLSKMLKELQEDFDREINPHNYSLADFKRKLKEKNHFLTTILREQKEFIIGDEEEFEKLFR